MSFILSNLRYFSTVQKRNHLFNEALGGLAFWREAGCTVLWERGCHEKKWNGVSIDTCSTPAMSESLSRSKIPIHSCAMFKCSENYVTWMLGKQPLRVVIRYLLALLLILG